MQKTKILLFDFGGVLIEWEGIQPLLELTNNRITPNQARRFWLESEWTRKFERGWCSPDEFASGVIRELDLNLTPNEFIAAFLTWDRGPMPGAVELLEELEGTITLACLSNNNSLHWPRLQKEHNLLRFFEYSYVSHEIGLVKPDPEIFDHVLSRLPAEATEITFFDDNPECVEAAEKSGIQAYQTRGVDELRSVLAKLGFQD